VREEGDFLLYKRAWNHGISREGLAIDESIPFQAYFRAFLHSSSQGVKQGRFAWVM